MQLEAKSPAASTTVAPVNRRRNLAMAALFVGLYGGSSLWLMNFIVEQNIHPEIGEWMLCALVIVVSWICLAIDRRSLTSIGLQLKPRFARELGIGMGLGVVMIAACALSILLLDGAHWRVAQHLTATGFALTVVFNGAVAIFEEVLFRGYLFQRMIDALGHPAALISLCGGFVVLHWSNPGMEGETLIWASINLGLAALFLSLAYLRTRSLALPIGLHFGWNWAQGGIWGFAVSGDTSQGGVLEPVLHEAPQWVNGGTFGVEASASATVVIGLAIVGLMKWWPR